MSKTISKRIRIPKGPTVVWKKDSNGVPKPTIVTRRDIIKSSV